MKVKCLDYSSIVDIKHDTLHRQSYESMLFLRSVDSNLQAAPLWKREDYKPSADALVSFQQDQVKGVS